MTISNIIYYMQLILRSVTGPRFSFPLGLLKTGRVTLDIDTTIKEELTSYNLNLPKLTTATAATTASSTTKEKDT